MSQERTKGEMPVTVPERARPLSDATIALVSPISSVPTPSDSLAPPLMLDSYQPRAMVTTASSEPPRSSPPYDHARESGLGDGQREMIVPSSATVASILEQVRRPPAERLEIEARVASGGMGAIDIAVDHALDRRVAVKTLHSHLRADDAAVRMFLREARLTGLLDHPHIVPVYDLGERRSGDLFFAMKLVQGQTLAALIRALPRGALDTATLYMLLDVVAKVCDALAFAHSRGVLHCDVKPANVMVGEFGQVFLTDWGIGRLITADAAPASVGAPCDVPETPRTPSRGSSTDNSVIGTPSYMSPEQARGDRHGLDVRSDVFLLGATLFELLAHRPPYVSTDRNEVLTLAAAGVFPSPRKVAGEAAVPLELERIVLRAMAKDPNERYPTVAELKEDLVRFMRGGAEFPRRHYGPGDEVVREGEPGDAAYILVEGRCEVRKGTPGGSQTLQTIGPGDVFGEMAILTGGARTATVVAIEPTTVLVVTSHVLEQEMAALKPWMATLLKSLATRFRNIDTQHRANAVVTANPAQLANQVLMNLMTWGDVDEGGRSIKWSALASALEAQLGSLPIALFSVIARYGLVLDRKADRLTAPDVEVVRARLRADL